MKLKIDITKIQDEKDYFKMKVIEMKKKNGSNLENNYSKKGEKNKPSANNKITINQLKKLYLDSTES